MDLIKHFYNLFSKRVPIKTDNNSNNPFMLQRFVLPYKKYVPDIIEINKHIGKIPTYMGECVMFHVLRKHTGYLKFLFKNKKKDKISELEYKVMEYLNCNLKRARESIGIFEKCGVDLKKYFGVK